MNRARVRANSSLGNPPDRRAGRLGPNSSNGRGGRMPVRAGRLARPPSYDATFPGSLSARRGRRRRRRRPWVIGRGKLQRAEKRTVEKKRLLIVARWNAGERRSLIEAAGSVVKQTNGWCGGYWAAAHSTKQLRWLSSAANSGRRVCSASCLDKSSAARRAESDPRAQAQTSHNDECASWHELS